MFSISEILDIAIKLEKNGKEAYTKFMEKTSDPDILSLLEWMVREEAAHIEWFGRMKRRIENGKVETAPNDVSQDLIEAFIGKQIFSLEDTDLSKIKSPEMMIQTFIEFERDTILFYEMLGAFIPDKAVHAHLKEIIDEEKTHVTELKALIKN